MFSINTHSNQKNVKFLIFVISQSKWMPVSVRSWGPLSVVYSVAHYSWNTKGFEFSASYVFNLDAMCGTNTYTLHTGIIYKILILIIIITVVYVCFKHIILFTSFVFRASCKFRKSITAQFPETYQSRMSFDWQYIFADQYNLNMLINYIFFLFSGEIKSKEVPAVDELNYFYHQNCIWILDSNVERQLYIELSSNQNRKQ